MANDLDYLNPTHLQGAAAEARAWLQSLGALFLDSAPTERPVPLPPIRRGVFASPLQSPSAEVGVRHGQAICTSFLDRFDDRPVMFVSDDHRQVSPYMGMLSSIEMVTAQRASLPDAIAEIYTTPTGWACLVVDIDDVGGFGSTIIDRLMALRERVSDLPVILLSSDVSLNDYSTERLTIADVTLRKPANLQNFEIGVLEAIENNLVWQQRITERRLEALCPCCRERATLSANLARSALALSQ